MKNLILVAAFIWGLGGAVLSAQQLPAEPTFHTRQKERIISPEEAVAEFSAPPVEAYTLFAGDEISIDVWAHPELSGKHVLGPDGKITLPLTGPFNLSDLTREAAQDAIGRAFTRFYEDLSVTVRVDRYSSWHIYVLGRVGVPGALQFDVQPNLLQVLTRAASLPVGGAGAEKAGLVRCAIFRGNDKIIWIDLKQLVARGNLALNIRLARNDLVYLPDADDQLIYVLGQVAHPGALRLTSDMSVLDAFSLSGGATEDAQARLTVIRPATGKQVDISLKDILSGKKSLDFSLEEGDILYVPEKNIAKFGYIMQKANPLTSFAIISNTLK
jgi:polysaccharide export outer membrane protein